jgi:hypothetical protein
VKLLSVSVKFGFVGIVIGYLIPIRLKLKYSIIDFFKKWPPIQRINTGHKNMDLIRTFSLSFDGFFDITVCRNTKKHNLWL